MDLQEAFEAAVARMAFRPPVAMPPLGDWCVEARCAEAGMSDLWTRGYAAAFKEALRGLPGTVRTIVPALGADPAPNWASLLCLSIKVGGVSLEPLAEALATHAPRLLEVRIGSSSAFAAAADLSPLGALTQVRHLHVSRVHVTTDSALAWQRMARLQALSLFLCPSLPEAGALGALTQLRSLVAAPNAFCDDDMPAIAQLRELCSLSVPSSGLGDAGAAALAAGLPQLRALSLGTCAVSHRSAALLTRMPRLRFLSCFVAKDEAAAFTAECVAALWANPDLEIELTQGRRWHGGAQPGDEAAAQQAAEALEAARAEGLRRRRLRLAQRWAVVLGWVGSGSGWLPAAVVRRVVGFV